MFNYKTYDKKRGIRLPLKNKDLAEFMGILTGDGYINTYSNSLSSVIAIAGHKKLDFIYLNSYVCNKIKKLFNIAPFVYIRKDQNTMYLTIYSKTLVDFIEKCGFKKGFKNNLDVPNWVLNNKNYFLKYIKGFYDTDGSLAIKKLHKKEPYYPTVSIANKNKEIMKTIFNFLNSKLSLTTYEYINFDKRNGNSYYGSKLETNGFKNTKDWFGLIKPSNPKHLDKFEKYVNRYIYK